MKVRTAILGAASAVAMIAVSASAALAGNFSGTLTGDYAHIDGSGSDANLWGVSGAGVFNLDGPWNIGLHVDYSNLDGSGFNTDTWSFGGNTFYRGDNGRLGVAVGYSSSDTGFGTFHVTNYGVGGEWWANKMWTFAAKGGGFSGSGSLDGYYLGGQVIGYVCPNVGISGTVDYAHLSGGLSETDYGVKAEWLVSESTPISVWGGYTGTDFNGFGSTGTVNTWTIGLTFYTNGDSAATSLVDRQRSGTLGWAGNFSPLALQL